MPATSTVNYSTPTTQNSAEILARNRALLELSDGGLHLAYRISGNAADAEDILQEAYIRAIRAQAPVLSGKLLRNWFLQIVANSARDLLRAEGARKARERQAAMPLNSSMLPQAEEQAELKRRVESELAKLDEKFRVPIALHYEHGLTYDEASSVVGIPAATLRVQACRGLDELRERLGVSGKPVTAEILVAALAAGFAVKASPAMAASVEALVHGGAAPAPVTAPVATSGARVFLPAATHSAGNALSICLQIVGAAALVGAAVFGIWKVWPRSSAPTTVAVSGETPKLLLEPPPSGVLPDPVQYREISRVVTTPPPPPVARQNWPRDYVPPPQVEAAWAGAVDMLPGVEPARDAVVGDWEWQGKDLFVHRHSFSRLQLNYYPPEEFDFRIDFTRRAGNAEVDLVFPVEGKSALLSVGAWNALYFSGHPAAENNPDTVPNLGLSNARHTTIVEVRRETLTAYLDGKMMKRIDIKNSMYQCNRHWRIPDQDALGLAVWDSDVAFHRVLVKGVSGPVKHNETDADLARFSTEAHWADAADLLAGIDLKSRQVAGNWSMEDKALQSGTNNYGRVDLGYEPPLEYDFRIDFHRIDGTRDIVQICSAQGHQFCWKMSADNVCVIDTIDGKVHAASPASLLLPEFFVDQKPHVSVVCVRKDGIKAYVDGKLLAKWKTDFSDMGIDIWKLKNIASIGIGAHASQVVFDRVLVKDIKGTGKRVGTVKGEDGGAF